MPRLARALLALQAPRLPMVRGAHASGVPMIRGRARDGRVILGVTRTEIEGLLAGNVCCFITRPELGGGPHICLWFAETDAALEARYGQMFGEEIAPEQVTDLRTKAN